MSNIKLVTMEGLRIAIHNQKIIILIKDAAEFIKGIIYCRVYEFQKIRDTRLNIPLPALLAEYIPMPSG